MAEGLATGPLGYRAFLRSLTGEVPSHYAPPAAAR
jgi:hypothetical protein